MKSQILELSQLYLSLLEATCLTEMSVMMACWKQNDFNDKSCAEEIRAFYDCVAKAEVMKITFMFLKSSSREGGETLSPFFVSQRNSVL